MACKDFYENFMNFFNKQSKTITTLVFFGELPIWNAHYNIYSHLHADQLNHNIVRLYNKIDCKIITGIITHYGKSLVMGDCVSVPYYNKKSHSISIYAEKYFFTKYDYQHTLLHEFAHSTIKHVPRQQVFIDRKQAYAFEEICAELSAIILSNIFGLSGASDDLKRNCKYIKCFLSFFDNETEIFFKAFKVVFDICKYLFEHAV